MDKTSNPYSQNVAKISEDAWNDLDQRIRRVDEDRWLSSRYAAPQQRKDLIALYAFFHELAKVSTAVSEPMLGAIRFQWWRDTLETMRSGKRAPAHDVAQALSAVFNSTPQTLPACIALIDDHQALFDEEGTAHTVLYRETAVVCSMIDADWTESNAPWIAGLTGTDNELEQLSVPERVRPALAHFRFRRRAGGVTRSKPIARRLSIMMAVLTGRMT